MHTRILKQTLRRGTVVGLAMAVLCAHGIEANAETADNVPLCSERFTVCLWADPASGPEEPGADHRALIRFLNSAASAPDMLMVRFTRTPLIPLSQQGAPQQCDELPSPVKQVETVAGMLADLDPGGAAADILRQAAGEDGAAIKGADVPACGAAFNFSVETDFRRATRLCGFDIRISDAGWPTDTAAAIVYRPVTLNGETEVIGEQATVRLTPNGNAALKPAAWIQLIAASSVGERAGKGFETTALLTEETEFEVAVPVTIRIGCGAAQMMSARARNRTVFSSRTAKDFLGWIVDDKKAISPELHPIDMESLAGGGNASTGAGCSAPQCGSVRITFDAD